MYNYNKYCKRGKFQWECFDYADNGSVMEETCTYKGKYYCNVIIRSKWDRYEIEIEGLKNEPYYITGERKSRKSARIFAERIIENDSSGNWKNNLKYIEKGGNE